MASLITQANLLREEESGSVFILQFVEKEVNFYVDCVNVNKQYT